MSSGAAAPPSPFIARAWELGELRPALEGMLAGSGTFWLILGEAGIGKTRLLEEFAADQTRVGVPIFWGRAHEDEGSPPYWPWIELARQVAASTDLQGLLRGLGPSALEIARILPGVTDWPERPANTAEPEFDRFLLFDAIARFFGLAAEPEGMVLVLEDLHASDEPSLQVLRRVVRSLPGSRLMVVATSRDPQRKTATSSSILSDLVSDSHTQLLRLDPLTEDEVGSYLDATWGEVVSRETVGLVHRRSGGNPLFLTELTRLLAESGWTPAASLPANRVPDRVREIVRWRLDRQSDECRSALEAGSVLGMEFDVELLSLIAGVHADQMLDSLDEAAAAHLLQPLPAPGGYAFCHGIVRDTVLEDLPTKRLIELHRACAESIEALRREGDPSALTELAWHWYQASATGEAQRAIVACRRAGDEAMRQFAFEQAVELYSMALASMQRTARDDELQCTLLIDLASARYRSGQITSSLTACLDATELARGLDRPDLIGEAALVVEGVGGAEINSRIAELCEEALSGLPEDRSLSLRVRLLAQRSMALRELGRVEEANALGGRALELAETASDPDATISAVHARQMAVSGLAQVGERTALGTRLIELAAEARRPGVAVWGHVWRAEAFIQLGDSIGLERELERLSVLAGRLGWPLARWHLTRLRAVRAQFSGHFEEAERLAREARAVGRRAQDPTADGIFVGFMGCLGMETGDFEAFDEAMAHLPAVPPLPVVRAQLAAMDLVRGDIPAARMAYEQLRALIDGLEMDAGWAHTVAYLAEMACAFDDLTAAERLYESLFPYADQMVGNSLFCLGSASRYLGMLAACLQRYEAAEEHMRSSIEMEGRAGGRPHVAHSHYALADLLVRSGAPAQAERAMGMATQCLEAAQLLGMRPLAHRVSSLIEVIRSVLEPPSPLSPREREVARMVAQGLSNREVAAALYLSERTVERHVQNIFNKLDLNSRTQLAAWAHRHAHGGVMDGATPGTAPAGEHNV